jgi:hypothetical protein
MSGSEGRESVTGYGYSQMLQQNVIPSDRGLYIRIAISRELTWLRPIGRRLRRLLSGGVQ